jgi:hypothetical protein
MLWQTLIRTCDFLTNSSALTSWNIYTKRVNTTVFTYALKTSTAHKSIHGTVQILTKDVYVECRRNLTNRKSVRIILYLLFVPLKYKFFHFFFFLFLRMHCFLPVSFPTLLRSFLLSFSFAILRFYFTFLIIWRFTQHVTVFTESLVMWDGEGIDLAPGIS